MTWKNHELTWKNGRAALLLVALLGVGVLAAYGAGPDAAATQTGETVEVVVGDLAANASVTGVLVPRRAAALESGSAGRVAAVNVRVGQTVAAGEALVALDAADLELNLAAAQLELRQAEAKLADLLADPTPAERAAAEAAVASAQAQLDDLQAGPSAAELAALEASLRAAEASLAAANADLSNAASGVTEADLKAAEAQLAAAQVQLRSAQDANQENTNQQTHAALMAAEQAVASAQARVNDLRDGPDTAAAQGSAGAAAARLESARADFERQVAGPTAAQVAAAQAQVADAQSSLAALQDGATAAQIAAAEAGVAQARLAVADAEEALARATVTAPFDGVVRAVHVQPGEIAGGAVAELVDLSSLEVLLSVDEIDVGHLAVGQAATVTLDSLPDATLPAEVTSIAPAATIDPASGLVTYAVRLRLEDNGLPLLAGMTANATLVTAAKADVLLVPNEAIQVDRTSGTYSVRRLNGDQVEEIEIAIGLRDNQNTEVLSGLSAGDVLLIADTSEPTLPGPGGGQSPFGGN